MAEKPEIEGDDLAGALDPILDDIRLAFVRTPDEATTRRHLDLLRREQREAPSSAPVR